MITTRPASTVVGARPGGGPPAVPPAGVPLAFLAAAGVGLVGFGLGLVGVAPTAVTAPTDPKVVADVHLAMLAFLSTAVLGAMHQFTPVIAADHRSGPSSPSAHSYWPGRVASSS